MAHYTVITIVFLFSMISMTINICGIPITFGLGLIAAKAIDWINGRAALC